MKLSLGLVGLGLNSAEARNDWELPSNWAFCSAASQIERFHGMIGGQGGPGGMGNDRIVGGGPAEMGTWPFIVRLKFGRNYLCGGSLIDGDTVLTAAHCCHGQRASGFEVFINDHFVFDDNDGQYKTTVKSLHYHKSFSWATFKNDVCILKLKDDVSHIINGLFPCMPPSDFDFDAGSVCYVAGWGLTAETASLSPVLKSVDVEIFEDKRCEEMQAHSAKEMICAGRFGGGKDACQGDSGGPLICEHHGRVILAGVTSWGIGCARAEHPGEWAKVSNYIDWITPHLNSDLTEVKADNSVADFSDDVSDDVDGDKVDDVTEPAKYNPKQVKRFCKLPTDSENNDWADFTEINGSMKGKEKGDKVLRKLVTCLIQMQKKRLQKVPEDEKEHELKLYKATRARMTCQRAKKNQVNIPCADKCQELIENLGPNTPNFPFSKIDREKIMKWSKVCKKRVTNALLAEEADSQ